MNTNTIQRMPLGGSHTLGGLDDLSDDESLFGSPPPSPNTERTVSLALPGGGLDSEQNVGTLALPGSHNPSKLPVDSVVSLLDGPHHTSEAQSSRASTPAQTTAGRTTPLTPAVISSNTVSPRTRSPNNGTSKKRKRAKKLPKTTITASSGPSIELPPSNAPVPPNFLRNQQALLGLAGLVGKINPMSLSARRHDQGSNPDNPIVVEDGRATVPQLDQPPTPTPAELLATLSAQKDLLPVLEKLLGILRGAADPPSLHPPHLSQQPLKKRKLTRVPAGATDWDIPFPFPPGEGPPNYKEQWANERCERLISDVITLLREGVDKAVVRASFRKATSQSVPPSPSTAQSHPASIRRSLPPTNDNGRPSSSNYVPLPLDAYLRPTAPHVYTESPQNHTETMSSELHVDFLEAIFGAVEPSQDNHLLTTDPFGPSTNPLPLGFDLDPLLLSLMGAVPSSGMGGAGASSDETLAQALPQSHCPQSTVPEPNSITPGFDPSIAIYPPSPPSPAVGQRGQVEILGSVPPDGGYFALAESLEKDLMGHGVFTGMELNMEGDDDFSRVFGMVEDAPLVNQQPHSCDPQSVGFPGLNSLSRYPETSGQVVSTPPASMPLSSVITHGTSDTPSLFAPQEGGLGPLPKSNFTTASLQRQRPVPKRPTPPVTPSKSKATATLAVLKKRREDAIQQAKDLRRGLLAEIGKSKVHLWELTMEQGVLTQISKDERLNRTLG